MKIVSLVPSITELLFDLGLKDQIIGRTKFCIQPQPEIKAIPQFGGTKNLHLDRIIALKPDLIIANKEENLKSEVEFLQQYAEVMVTDVSDLQQNNEMILEIGQRTGTSAKATEIISAINSEFDKLPDFEIIPKTLYLIWNQPMMSVGHDTFIHHMLQRAGFVNICAQLTRYPEIQAEKFNPELILLSSEPFPFKEKHITNFQRIFPDARIVLADGEMFSWYGSRMRLAPADFLQLRQQIGLS